MTPWGLARIEVIASKEHITRELQRGVPMKQIHEALVGSGRVSVTYNSFRRQIQPLRDRIKTLSVDTPPGPVDPAPASPPKPVKTQGPPRKSDREPPSGFRFDPSCKADDFF